MNAHSTAQQLVHVCIATGQNAANLIPLEQLDAREIWILQTPAMREGAKNLDMALRREGRVIRKLDFDDRSPVTIERSAQDVATQLDGRHVILHATGGTKLMVLALRDGLRLVETGLGRLDILYAETHKQQIDWLGQNPRTEPMVDVLDLRQMLLVQGYRIEGDSRLSEPQQRASTRADLTREMAENAAKYGGAFSAIATLASFAADSRVDRDLTQQLNFKPQRQLSELLQRAQVKDLLQWDGDLGITFTDPECARYIAGGWLEEYVLLKLTGLFKPNRFGSNLNITSSDNKVPNELDAMVVHQNRALLIECKTGKQVKAQEAIYKLAQLRDRLGGSVAQALYLSAQTVDGDVQQRAREYRVEVLDGERVGQLVQALKRWRGD